MKNTFDLRKFLTENKNSIKEENINELTGEQQDALRDLQNILDDAARLGDEAREIIRKKFPRMLTKGDAYGVFEFGSSANSYDTTLSSIIEEIEQYYDEEEYDEEDLDQGVINENHEQIEISPRDAEQIDSELDTVRKEAFFKEGAWLIHDHIKSDRPSDLLYIHQVISHLANRIHEEYFKRYRVNEEEEDEIKDVEDMKDNPLQDKVNAVQDRINKLKDAEEVKKK